MWKRLIVISAVTVLAVAAAACSDDGDKEGAATPTPSVCDQKDALEQSLQDLATLNIISEGTSGLTAAVDNVRTDLVALKDTVSADIAPEVQALQTAVDDAKETLSNIDSDAALSRRIADVETALTGIATASADLRAALDNECS